MTQMIHNVITLSAFALVLANVSSNGLMNETVKIVNASSTRDLKQALPPEDKTGAVSYVYPANKTATAPPASTLKPVPAASSAKVQPAQVASSPNMQPVQVDSSAKVLLKELNPRFGSNDTAETPMAKEQCVSRVIEIVRNDAGELEEKLVVYNATSTEVESYGKEVFDTVCSGDIDWDKVISAGALASLCCG